MKTICTGKFNKSFKIAFSTDEGLFCSSCPNETVAEALCAGLTYKEEREKKNTRIVFKIKTFYKICLKPK